MSSWKASQERLVEREADVVYWEDCTKSKKFIKINKEAVYNDEKTAKEERDWTRWIDEEDEEGKNYSRDNERERVDNAETMQVCFDWRVRLRTTLESIFCNDRRHHFFVCVSLVNNSSSLRRTYTTR